MYKILLATTAICGLAASAQAVAIPANSSFDIAGSISATTASTFDQATALTPVGAIALGGFVNPVYGTKGFTTGTAGAMNAVANLSSASPAIPTFYTFASGANTLTFDLSKITLVNRTPANPSIFVAPTINFYGTGVITLSGYAPTKGSFSFSTSNTGAGTTATFQSSVNSLGGAVPEPSSWAMFLGGFGAIGYGLRSRRRSTTALA